MSRNIEIIQAGHDLPSIHELVQLKSRDVLISPIWAGEAELQIFNHPCLELPDLRPASYEYWELLLLEAVAVDKAFRLVEVDV